MCERLWLSCIGLVSLVSVDLTAVGCCHNVMLNVFARVNFSRWSWKDFLNGMWFIWRYHKCNSIEFEFWQLIENLKLSVSQSRKNENANSQIEFTNSSSFEDDSVLNLHPGVYTIFVFISHAKSPRAVILADSVDWQKWWKCVIKTKQ